MRRAQWEEVSSLLQELAKGEGSWWKIPFHFPGGSRRGVSDLAICAAQWKGRQEWHWALEKLLKSEEDRWGVPCGQGSNTSGASSGLVWLRQGEWLSWDYQPFPTQPWACIMLRKACFCLHIGCSFLCRQCPLLICFPSDIGIKGWAGRYAVCICIDFFLVALLVPVDTNPTQTGWNNTNWNKQNCWLM